LACACTALFLLVATATHAGAVETRAFRTPVQTANGQIELYAEETGIGGPIVLIHGLGESTFTWRKVVPGLARDHRVIALDLKGFGRSDKPREESYSADDQAALVAQFLEALDVRGATLIGHSFGGTVALRTALVTGARERISRIAVIGAPALPRSVAPYLDAVEIPLVPDALTAALSPELLARLLLREARGGRSDFPEDDVKGYAAPYYELEAKHAFLATARSIVSEKGDAVAASYRNVTQPALLIWCRRDGVVPLRNGKRLAKTLPNARLSVLEGCHHLPQEEKPERLLEVLRRFLRS
jgi:pimeloyl-ACP methyl ester carboxylesterase